MEPLRASDGILLHWVGVNLDIEKQKQAEFYLEEAQRVAHVGYWEWDLTTDHVIWSDETYRIYGLQPQERPMDVATIRELVHPGDREFVSRVAAKAIQGEVRADVEHRIVRPGGEVRVVAILSGPSARGAKLTVSDTVASSLQNTFEKIVTISFVTRARMGHPAE